MRRSQMLMHRNTDAAAQMARRNCSAAPALLLMFLKLSRRFFDDPVYVSKLSYTEAYALQSR
jgi:hypothetical protein